MKKLLLLPLLYLAVSCSTQKKVNEVDNSIKIVEDALTVTLPKASVVGLSTDVSYLSSDELEGRDTGSDGILKASGYIVERFRELGLQTYKGSYLDAFEVKEDNAFNVVGVLPGSDGKLKSEVVVIGAHYDHIGFIQEVAGDSLANGANDNASGTAAVMNIARILKAVDFNKRTVVFALFSAEERGLLGSKNLAQVMKDNNENVVAMLNFEMIGVPMTAQPYRAYLTGHDSSNMAQVFNQANKKTLVTGKLEQAAAYNLYKRSDNYPFAQQFNVPAQTFSTFDFTNYDYYHKPGDEADKMDARHMAQVVDAVMPGIMEVINGDRLKMIAQ